MKATAFVTEPLYVSPTTMDDNNKPLPMKNPVKPIVEMAIVDSKRNTNAGKRSKSPVIASNFLRWATSWQNWQFLKWKK